MRLAIVVPCYNEEDRLDTAAFRQFVGEEGNEGIEFVFVNDGSHDGTAAVLERLAAAAPERFSLLDLPENCGKGEAVRQGILFALARRPDTVGFWDADLATPLLEIRSFTDVLAHRPAVEMVFGARVRLLGRDILRRASRHYVGRVGATLISQTLGLAVYDTQCGAKLFRVTESTAGLFGSPFLSRWLFDVELIARLIQLRGRAAAGQAIYELPIRTWHDVHGSKVGGSDFLRALIDLWKIRKTYLK